MQATSSQNQTFRYQTEEFHSKSFYIERRFLFPSSLQKKGKQRAIFDAFSFALLFLVSEPNQDRFRLLLLEQRPALQSPNLDIPDAIVMAQLVVIRCRLLPT